MNELALFSGAGGGILGGVLLGWRTVCAVEINPYVRRILLARQNDGCLPPFPVFDDVRSFDGGRWRGCVDIVTGGFPCQDISAAGRGAGITGEKSGLWKEMARIIGEVRPRYILVENSLVLTSRGLGTVLGDLAEEGYDAEWGVFSACSVGAPHTRERMFIMAYSNKEHGTLRVRIQHENEREILSDDIESVRRDWLQAVSQVAGGANGLADEVDRLEGIGNGQVPSVVALAWRMLIRAGSGTA